MEKPNEGYKLRGTGLGTKEKRWAEDRFNEYRSNYPHLHKMSDLVLLEELVFQETLHERLKEKISDLTKKLADIKKDDKNNVTDTSGALPKALQEQLAENIDLQFQIKEKLGLFEDKKVLDAFRHFREQEEKFTEYRKQNPEMFKTTCPKCAFPYFLKRKTIDYEPIGTNWFRNKVLVNEPLFRALLSNEPLTKKQVAEILGVSDYYVDWVIEKFFTEKPSVDASDTPVSDAESSSSETPEEKSS